MNRSKEFRVFALNLKEFESLNSAILDILDGEFRVFALNLKEFESIREIRYMSLDEILQADQSGEIIYFKVVRNEN